LHNSLQFDRTPDLKKKILSSQNSKYISQKKKGNCQNSISVKGRYHASSAAEFTTFRLFLRSETYKKILAGSD